MRRGMQFIALKKRRLLGALEAHAADLERAVFHQLALHVGERQHADVGAALCPRSEARVRLRERVLRRHLRGREHLSDRRRHVGQVADEDRHLELLEFLEAKLELLEALGLVADSPARRRIVAVAVPEEEIERDHAVGLEVDGTRGGGRAVAHGREEEEAARHVGRDDLELWAREAHHVDETEAKRVVAIAALLAHHAAEAGRSARADDGDAQGILRRGCVRVLRPCGGVERGGEKDSKQQGDASAHSPSVGELGEGLFKAPAPSSWSSRGRLGFRRPRCRRPSARRSSPGRCPRRRR